MSKFDVLGLVLTVVWIAVSIVQICFSAFPLAFSSKHSQPGQRTFTFTTTSTNQQYLLAWLPLYTRTRGYILQASTGSFGVVLGSIVLIALLRKRPFKFACTGRQPPKEFSWPFVSAIVFALFFSLALPSLVISFYDEDRYGSGSVHMSLCLAEYSSVSTCSIARTLLEVPLTVEGWVCGLSNAYSSYGPYLTDDAETILPRICTRTTTARYLTIPLLVLPFLVVAAGLLEKRRQNMNRYQNSHDMARKETSFGSSESNMASMSPNDTLPEYPGTELHGSQKLSVEVPNKEIVEAPEAGRENQVAEMPVETHRTHSELPAAGPTDRS